MDIPETFETIKGDQIIDIKISTSVYERLNQFIFEHFPAKDENHFLELLELIKKEDETSDRLAYHLKTLIYIQSVIEKGAREQGAIKKITESELKERFQNILNTEENQSSPQ
jgi:hypothetical protein